MQKKDIAIIAVRLLALYFIVIYALALLDNASMLLFYFAKYDAGSRAVLISDIMSS